ncbi:unnamed protein product [Polarella glacialis]|uniref:glucose-6-phosphatase n=1 Tax=Polarella glacialis TaxID=89957 RepID=A0A813F401_POLGL|nr:unnamed protein product [Polarella glacialis]
MAHLVNALHLAEVPLVLFAQRAFHPTMAFTALAPFLFAVSRRALAIELLLVFCVADLSNLVIKWVIAGNRPYWVDPEVWQFPMTCEGGWGMPSGHMQAFSTVTYFIIFRTRAHKAWFMPHGAMCALGAYSRVYTGSHFPSQTLAGWALGLTFGFFGSRLFECLDASQQLHRGTRLLRISYLGSLIGVLGIMVFGVHAALELAGLDPLTSLPLARGACRTGKVVGLIWEGTAKVFGVLIGTAAVAVLQWPCSKDAPALAQGVLHRWTSVAGLMTAHHLLLDRFATSAAAYNDGPDGPTTLLSCAAIGYLNVVLAAGLACLLQLLLQPAKQA